MHQAGVGDHEGKAQGHQHLGELGARQAAQQQPLDQPAQHGDAHPAEQSRAGQKPTPQAIRLTPK